MDQASVTALATSLMRAVHTRLDRPALIDDPWGDRLVLEPERDAMAKALGGHLEDALRAHPTYGTVIVRTRYAEDALQAAVARGVRQYVIVGAGMDSFALRLPPFAADVEVFEVDHPATQELKRNRLRERGVSLPAKLHFVAADLSEEGLDAVLARSPFRVAEPAFFSWLGVTTYLTREANLATLRAIASCAAPGSELVFTYVDQREFDPDPGSAELKQVRETVQAAGEPWVSGFHPSELADDLRGVGLALVEDLAGEELRARYCSGRNDDLSPAAAIHVARAQVTAG